jgi:hypothetical protein
MKSREFTDYLRDILPQVPWWEMAGKRPDEKSRGVFGKDQRIVETETFGKPKFGVGPS